METLRRLRTVWTVLCFVGLAVVAVAWYGGTHPMVVAPLAVMALAFAAAPHFRAGGAFAAAWVGLTALVMANDMAQTIDRARIFGGGISNHWPGLLMASLAGYLGLVAVAWVIKPMFNRGDS